MNTNTLYELALPLMTWRIIPDRLIEWAARRGTESMLDEQWRALSDEEQHAVYRPA